MVHPADDAGARGERRRGRMLRVVAAGADVEGAGLEKPCACGHGRAAHQHYRRGSDCSLCACGTFRRPLLARLGLRGR